MLAIALTALTWSLGSINSHMKVLILISLMISVAICCNGQKLVKKKENDRYGKNIYYVLKDNPEIKHGEYYQKSWSGNTKLIEGQYDNGKRVGLWIERFYMKSIRGNKKSEGNYQDDKKVGEWTYFNFKGQKVQVYDYTSNQLIYSQICESKKDNTYNVVTADGKIENKKLDCPPQYVGGESLLANEAQTILTYPQELNTNGVDIFEINTDVIFNVKKDGQIGNVSFTKKIGYGIEEKIESWLKGESKKWIPAKLEGEYVEAQLVLPIRQRFQF